MMVDLIRIYKEILKHSKGILNRWELIRLCQIFIWNHQLIIRRLRIHGIKKHHSRDLRLLPIKDNQVMELHGIINNKKNQRILE